MQFAANFLAQFALFTIFFVKQSLSQSLTSGFAGLTPPSGFAQPSFAQPSYSSFFPPGYSQPSGLTPQLMPYKSNLNSYPGLGGYSSYISPYTYGDSHTVGSILQPSGGGIERPERNEYYSTYNAYNNQAAYPRYSGAGNGLNSFNYPSSFSSAYSPPNFATGYSPPNFGNSGLGTGYLG